MIKNKNLFFFPDPKSNSRVPSASVDCRRLLKRYLDRDTDDEANCNIRIDINGIINSRLGNFGEDPITSPGPPDTVSSPRLDNSHSSNVANMNVKTLDTINLDQLQHQFQNGNSHCQPFPLQNNYDPENIDDLIRTLCTLKISQSGIALPQIVLTDCSTDATTAIQSTSINFNSTTGATDGSTHAKATQHRANNGCLSIPHEIYYRSESRPP